MLTLAHFLDALDTGYRPDGTEPAISAVVTDSRDAGPGSLFVALPGSRVDGHDFVAEAFSRGAIAALVSHVPAGLPALDNVQLINTFLDMVPQLQPGHRYLLQVRDTVTAMHRAAEAWRNRFSLRIIGITGSVGKTSTKELTHAVLSQRGLTMKTPGNRNSILGLPPALFSLRPYHRWAVLEMGMYTVGEIKQLCAMTRPHVGVVTMIDAVHMERAGSLENIVRAKQELVEALPAGGTAILNKDEPLVMGMAQYTQAKVLTYGLDPEADLWADEIESMGLNGIRFTLHTRQQSLRLQVPLLGQHSVHTVLRAAAVGRNEGLTWDEIAHGLQETPTQLRIVTTPGPAGSLILDDTYNASPASMMAALNLLADLNGRRVAVLGDMLELGPAEESSHRLVGRRALQVAQVLVTVGTRGQVIGEEAMQAGMPSSRVHICTDAGEAITLLLDIIQAGDTVLVKGSRAVNMDQIVAAISRPVEESS